MFLYPEYLLSEAYQYLKTDEHIALCTVEDIEFCHYFAYIVAGYLVTVFFTVSEKCSGTAWLIVILVEIYAGVHPALKYTDIAAIISKLLITEDKNIGGFKDAVFKV